MRKTHGTRTSYNAGCRCRKCKNANNAYLSQYRSELTPQPAQRSKSLWQPWEDDLAGDYTKSARQIAQILERTPPAVSNRRRILLARRKKQEAENKK